MRIMNLVLCDDGKTDKTIRVLASDGKLYDIADIDKNLFDILIATRFRGSLQVDGSVTWPEQYKIHYSYIPNGADLNDDTYKISGYYRSNDGSATISNAPPGIGGAFELIVTGIGDGNYCTQRVKDYRNNTEWVRTQTTWREPWVWTDWNKITHSDTLNTVLSDYAKLSSPNNLIHSGNEFTFAASEQKGDVWINYKTVGGTRSEERRVGKEC